MISISWFNWIHLKKAQKSHYDDQTRVFAITHWVWRSIVVNFVQFGMSKVLFLPISHCEHCFDPFGFVYSFGRLGNSSLEFVPIYTIQANRKIFKVKTVFSESGCLYKRRSFAALNAQMKQIGGNQLCLGECLLWQQTDCISLSKNIFSNWFASPGRPLYCRDSRSLVGNLLFDCHERTVFETESFPWFTRLLSQSNVSVVIFSVLFGWCTKKMDGVLLRFVFREPSFSWFKARSSSDPSLSLISLSHSLLSNNFYEMRLAQPLA